MKRLIVIVALLLIPALSHADIQVSGGITSDTTWSPSSGAYLIQGHVAIQPGVTLTIEPGTVVKQIGGDFSEDALIVYGNLDAQGSASSKIYFTSYADDSVGGDSNGDGSLTAPTPNSWQGIKFKAGSQGNLSYVEVRYGGGGVAYPYRNQTGLTNDGGMVNIDRSTFYENGAFGIEQDGGYVSVSNSVIDGNSLSSVGIDISNGSADVSGNTIENNRDLGAGVYDADGITKFTDNSFINNHSPGYTAATKYFVHSGNTSNDTAERVWRYGGSISTDTSWSSDDLPIEPFVSISPGATLTIEPGTLLKFAEDEEIIVNGKLVIDGTNDKPVVLTSIMDDNRGGDSNVDGSSTKPSLHGRYAIDIYPGATVDIDYADFYYGGTRAYTGFDSVTMGNHGGSLNIANSKFEDSLGYAVWSTSGINNITDTEFSHDWSAIDSKGAAITMSQSSVHDVQEWGVNNESTVPIDARNNWWGSPTGPTLNFATTTPSGNGDAISDNVLYVPWLTSDPFASTTPTRIPVIIVPGIMGSYLNLDDYSNEEIWPNVSKMILPGPDSYLNDLELDATGKEIIVIKPTSILASLSGFDFFNNLQNKLTSLGYTENQDLVTFPYDWRLDLSEEAEELATLIDNVKDRKGVQKVNLIVHSMGGLVAKEYLNSHGGQSIDNFIDIATPQYGAPKAFKALNYGDNFGFEKFGLDVLNQDTAKIIIQNMPSAYELLPSQSYFDSTNNDYKYYVWDGVGGNTRLTYDQTRDYLKNAGRNSSLVDRADAFHQEIDGLNPADYGVKTYNIVGCGTPTIGQFYILNKEDNGDTEYDIKMISGDGTVPLKSAEAIPALKTYFVTGAEHATLPSTSGVKELVAGLLSTTTNPDISAFSNIKTSESECPKLNGKIVSFHSPIDLHVYDASGNHVGPDANGDIEENIPGVDYEVIDNNKFAYLPDGQEYKIVGGATGSGSFDARVETITDGNVSGLTYFNQVPISTTTEVTFNVGPTVPDSISIDADGDGLYESSTTASSVLAGGQAQDFTKPVTTINLSGNQKNGSFTSTVKATLAATDDNSGVLKTEYSLDEGITWTLYTEPFAISTRGGTTVLYRSTDKAGNVENPKPQLVNIIYPGSSGKK